MTSWYGDPDTLNDAALEARDNLDRWGHVTPDEFERMTLETESSIPVREPVRPKVSRVSARREGTWRKRNGIRLYRGEVDF